MINFIKSEIGLKHHFTVIPSLSDQLRRLRTPSQEPKTNYSGSRLTFCAAKKKGVRLIITLECTEAKAEGGVPSRYITQKNKKNKPGRLELMKFNPLLRRHTLHREIK